MRNIWTITWRELKAYFVSPLAYILIAAFTVAVGFLFYLNLRASQQASLDSDFGLAIFLMMFFAPLLTMRLLAEEQRMGTLELLLTAPVRDYEIVLGKFFASLAVYIAMLVPTLWHWFILERYGSPDTGPVLSGYLGVLLVGGAFLSIGILTSALSANQVVAAFVSMATLIMLWVIGAGVSFTAGTGPLADFLQFLTVTQHYQDFLNGVIDSQHIIYFLSIILVALFITTRLVESRRWR